VQSDGSQNETLYAVTPHAVVCDPRVQSRVQRHINLGAGSFNILELVGTPGLATWQRRKLYVTETEILVKTFACATASDSCTSYPLTVRSIPNICVNENDDERSILTFPGDPGCMLHLRSETSLKRDVLVMLLRHWMYDF
jgi:hypothetical protein